MILIILFLLSIAAGSGFMALNASHLADIVKRAKSNKTSN